MTDFITDFMTWLGQFVVASTVLLVVTHLFARKRRERKRVAQLQAEEQSDSTELVEEPEPVRAG